MQVILKDGPSNGTSIYLPRGTTVHYVPIPEPVDILAPFDNVDDIFGSLVDYKVATYRFTGMGFVGLDGVCRALIFQYDRTY